MDTRTGRIFDPAVMERLADPGGVNPTVAIEELLAAKEAEAAGALVPVSNEVVQKIRLGEREQERRRRRRKASREARRLNRG